MGLMDRRAFKTAAHVGNFSTWCVEMMPKSDISSSGGVGGGYGSFQGHMSAHDLALNQGTQQQGVCGPRFHTYLLSSPLHI